MRYVLEFLLLAGFVVGCIAFIIWAAKEVVHALRNRSHRSAPWTVEKDDDTRSGETLVLLTHPDEEPYVIGRVPITLPHWEYDTLLDDLMVEAEAKADSRNRRLP